MTGQSDVPLACRRGGHPLEEGGCPVADLREIRARADDMSLVSPLAEEGRRSDLAALDPFGGESGGQASLSDHAGRAQALGTDGCAQGSGDLPWRARKNYGPVEGRLHRHADQLIRLESDPVPTRLGVRHSDREDRQDEDIEDRVARRKGLGPSRAA